MCRRPLSAVALITLLWAGPTPAQYVWTGGGGTNLWNDVGNWSAAGPPVSHQDTRITFLGATQLTNVQNIANPLLLNRILFDNGAGAYNLTGQALDFRTRTDGDAPTIALGQNNGAVPIIGNDLLLTNSLIVGGGGGNVILGGGISGPGGLTFQALGVAGVATLSGAGTYGGETSISSGTVLVDGTLSAAGAAGVAVFNGGTLGGIGTINRPVTMTGPSSLRSAGTLTLGSTLTAVNASNRITAGTVSVAGATTLNSSGVLTIDAGATLGGAGGIFLNGDAALQVDGSTAASKAITMTHVDINFRPALRGLGVVGGSVTMTYGTIEPSGAGTFRIDGPITITGGPSESSIGNTNASTLELNGLLRIAGGTTRARGSFTGTGGVQVDPGATLIASGPTFGSGKALTVRGSLLAGSATFGGLVTLDGGSIQSDASQFNGSFVYVNGATVSGTGASVAGLTTAQSGTVTLNAGAVLNGAGGFLVESPATLANNSNGLDKLLTVRGTYNSASTFSRPLTLEGGKLTSGGTMTLTSSLTQASGTSQITNGTVSVSGLTVVNAGLFRILFPVFVTGGGAVNVNAGGALEANGTVNKAVTLAGLSSSAQAVLGGSGSVGALTVNAFGQAAPGNSVGTLTAASADFAADGILAAELGPSGASDRLALGAGTLNFATGARVNVSAFRDTQPRSYPLATLTDGNNLKLNGGSVADGFVFGSLTVGSAPAGSVLLGADTGLFVAGDQFSLQRSGTNLVLSFTPVPEPASTLAVFAAGTAGAVWWRRRRRPA